jgi:tight adherence protein B
MSKIPGVPPQVTAFFSRFTSFPGLFFMAFVCFFVAYKLCRGSEDNEEYKKKLEAKVGNLAKQQEALLENAGSKVSTFAKMESGEFGTSDRSKNEMFDKVKRIMKKAGITEISVEKFTVLCFVGGCLFTAGLLHFDFLNPVTGVPVGMFVGAYLTYNMLSSRAQERKMQFLRMFPDAIDMMVRGVKAGLNIGRIMKLVSQETKDPLAGEFKTISQRFDLGVKPEDVLVDAAERIDIEEFRFLVVALVLQMENGGVLVEILQNLSGIVRKRLELELKLKALSAEARMSAIVISALPFVFIGIMALINPDHIKEFTTPGAGQTMTKVAVTLFSMGTFMMMKASKIKV